MDTPALLGRDLSIFPKVLKALEFHQPIEPASKKLPYTIFYPSDFIPTDSPEQATAMENFIYDMSQGEEGCHQKISIQGDWKQTAPVEEKNLHEYLHHVSNE